MRCCRGVQFRHRAFVIWREVREPPEAIFVAEQRRSGKHICMVD